MWMHSPLAIIQGIYAKYYGMSLASIAAVILFARVFDAVTDPLVGCYSDRYRCRTGTRKSFVALGSLLMIVSAYFLYIPLSLSIGYFCFWLALFYLAHTLFEIPHFAWASELAPSSKDKSTIYSFRSIGIFLGGSLFYLVPLLPVFETRDVTPITLKWSALSSGLLMIVTLFICMKYTPNGFVKKLTPEDFTDKMRPRGVKVMLYSVFKNRALCIFLSCYVFYGLGIGMWYGLVFLYVDSYLGLGGSFAEVYLASFVSGIVWTVVWWKISLKIGKKGSLILAFCFVIASFIYAAILEPGKTNIVDLYALLIIQAIGTSCVVAMAPAMLSKIADYGHWKYREENTASYFSVFNILTKANVACGAAISLLVASKYGLDPTSNAQSSDAAFGLFLSMSVWPSLFLVVAILLMLLSPINARRHDLVRRRLAAGHGW